LQDNMNSTDIKCPYCNTPVLKDVYYSSNIGYFHAKHKCRRCKKIYTIKLTPETMHGKLKVASKTE